MAHGAVPKITWTRRKAHARCLSRDDLNFLAANALARHAHTAPRQTADVAVHVLRIDGKVKVRHVYPLAEAAQVNRDLEGRRTVGSIVMIL
jgi:hypothetical protein